MAGIKGNDIEGQGDALLLIGSDQYAPARGCAEDPPGGWDEKVGRKLMPEILI